MFELIVLIVIIAIILGYFNRTTLKQYFSPNKKKYYTIDDQFNSEKREREKEIDKLLSKMGKNGIKDLSSKERKRLDELSQK